MIKKLAKKIFFKEIAPSKVIALIEDYIKANQLDKRKVYETLSSELMKLKATSVYLNSDFIKRDIKAEIKGFIVYLNIDAGFDDVLFIIGPSSTNVNTVLSQINELIDSDNSDEQINKQLKKIQKSHFETSVEIKFMSEFKNPKNISRLRFDIRQGEEIQFNQTIGYFEDFEFNTTAKDYMEKYSIVDQYCTSMLNSPIKTKVSDKPSKVAEIKNKTLIDIWNKSEIDKYDQFIKLLKEENTLPQYTPETSIAFLKENKDGKLKWTKIPSRGWQRYIGGFLRVLADNDFIDILNFSAKQLMEISINSFLDEKDKLSNDAFIDSKNNFIEDKYLIPFQRMIKRLK